MTRGTKIFIFISSLAISLLSPFTSQAQESAPFSEDYDSVAFVNGFSVSVDLVGIIQRAVSDYGQIEASLRLNLLDRYFPIIEAGVGLSKHEDVVTLISYKSNAPFFRIGMDYNLMQLRHIPPRSGRPCMGRQCQLRSRRGKVQLSLGRTVGRSGCQDMGTCTFRMEREIPQAFVLQQWRCGQCMVCSRLRHIWKQSPWRNVQHNNRHIAP